ncbi:sigma-70 family RNA polymerase sigma factor [Rapidithrix thailandica]|uniref:Sigma-70 family RNA polymerase sigma factor n=1 Tax=Rapidithrix thailandica TaxID=413964 RepID=A0AAW9S1E4_9BACT
MRQLKITQSITNRRESHTLEKYFNEISKQELLTPEEEVELARRIKQGDRKALEKLVNANLRFVVSVAKQYQNRNLPLNDLINEGNLGLVKAAQKFDETRGFKFISYAVWWIRQTIMQAIAEQSRIVRLPMNRTGALNKIHKTMAELEQRYEREPTAEELSEILEMDEFDITNTVSAGGKHMSLDAPFQEGESNSLYDVMPDHSIEKTNKKVDHNDSLSVETDRVLSTLQEREKKILKMFFGIGYEHPMSLENIGEELGLTRERVRQIKEKAIKKLQASSKRKLLAEYLG